MGGFISLPRARIHEKEPTKKLKNRPTDFVESFYKDWLDGTDFSGDRFSTVNCKSNSK